MLREELLTYKKIQILTAQINTCFKDSILPSILLICVHSILLGTYLAISIREKLLDHVGNLLFPLCAIFAIGAVFGIGTMTGFVNKGSIQVIRKLRNVDVSKCGLENRSRNLKVIMKFSKSLSPMKIRFGNNFMSISTPLVILVFCARNIVRLLLIR